MRYTFTITPIKDKIELEIPEEVYYPEEDSFLLLDTLIQEIKGQQQWFLEVGGGSGIITIALAKKFTKTRYIVNDISFSAAKAMYDNIRINKVQSIVDVIQMDLINGLREFKPDILVWNPPYLPIDENKEIYSLVEQKMLFGGKKGYEYAYQFLEECKKVLSRATIFTVLSSLGWNPEMTKELSKNKKMKAEIVNRKKLPFETLYVLKVTIESAENEE